MAKSFFRGDDSDLAEIVFADSDDELGMEDMEHDDSEAAFEPLETTTNIIHFVIYN